MEKLILLKYGELTTKKDNRKYFVKTLYKNIEKKLEGLEVKIEYNLTRMYVWTTKECLDDVVKGLKEVFGIYSIVIYIEVYIYEENKFHSDFNDR